MKTLIIPLILTSLSPAFGQSVSAQKIMDQAAKQAGQINEVVANVGTLSSECREETKHLNRGVLIKDPLVPVIACVPDATSLTAPDPADYTALLREYNIETHPDAVSVVSTREFRLFIHELKKFPVPLLKEMAAAGGRMRIFLGDGVTNDPEWNQDKLKMIDRVNQQWAYYNKYGGAVPSRTAADIEKSYSTTTEGGRNWDLVSGSGGVFMDPTFIQPTRIVLNRMYKSKHRLPDGTIVEWDQGATNLLLHEHGHALDNLYGHHAVSGSDAWKKVMKDEKTKTYLKKIFSPYEDTFEEEGFAEAFAYYHACEASRTQMETHAPELAKFIRDFKSVKDLRPDLHQAWKTRYKK